MSVAEKRLRIGMVWGGVESLPLHTSGPRGEAGSLYAATVAAGYEGMQGGDPVLCREHGLVLLGAGVIPTAADVEPFVARWKGQGAKVATCIAGFGYESDVEVDALTGAILRVASEYKLPLYIETHRASITQDAWRTVQLAKRIPDVRFNGDYSHWFTGQEMAYGDFDMRLDHLAPVFERTRFLHGRIGSRCCMQVDLDPDLQHSSVAYFRKLWVRTMREFLVAEPASGELWFCPELLGMEYAYAAVTRNAEGEAVEDGDRWTQAALIAGLAKDCFKQAQQLVMENCGDTLDIPS